MLEKNWLNVFTKNLQSLADSKTLCKNDEENEVTETRWLMHADVHAVTTQISS